MERETRKLAAILSADVVGYSRLMEDDEARTVRALHELREVLTARVRGRGGRVIDCVGDALLADFRSAVDAVECACEVQADLAHRGRAHPEGRRMRLRIGINLGEVLEQDGAVFGDGVNVAARVESLAEAGGICVSGKVFDEVDGKVRRDFTFLGEKKVKNLARPVRVYQVLTNTALRLRLLGPLEVERGGERASLPQSRKTKALLAYLVVTGRTHRRERLCDLLWDVADDPRAGLRWCLSKLRPILDEPHAPRIIADRETVAVDATEVFVDLFALRSCVDGALEQSRIEDLEEVAAEFRGGFLEGLDFPDLDTYHAWWIAERRHVVSLQARLLRTLVERLAAEPDRALPHARALVELEPDSAWAQARFATMVAAGPQASGEAVAVPPPATDADRPSPGSAGEPDDEEEEEAEGAEAGLSIAVLPFQDMGGDDERDFLAEGIAEDLITALSKISDLLVIARNSTFVYRGQTPEIRHVARELGVRYVLTGSVRRSGSHVRVGAQLVDSTTARQIWGHRYDRELTDVFVVQDEITREIVTALEVKLTQGEQARLWRRRAGSLEAYEHYLRGIDHYNRFARQSNAQARQEFERAIEVSSEFAAAYGYLGWVHTTEAQFGWTADGGAALDEALRLAEHAIALDDTLADAYAVRSSVLTLRGHHDRSVAEAERAVALNPNGALVHHILAMALIFAGDPQEAIGVEKHALRLSPLAQDNFLVELGHAYWLAGRSEEAVEPLTRVLESRPSWLTARTLLALAQLASGREAEARVHVEEILRRQPTFSSEAWSAQHPYKHAEHRRRHLKELRRAGLPA